MGNRLQQQHILRRRNPRQSRNILRLQSKQNVHLRVQSKGHRPKTRGEQRFLPRRHPGDIQQSPLHALSTTKMLRHR